jgi:hypothetical protein
MLTIPTTKEINALTSSDLVRLHNTVLEELNDPELKPVKKFTNKETAVERVKKVLKALAKTRAPVKEPKRDGRRRGTNLSPQPGSEPKSCREGSKQAAMVDILSRKRGASMPEIIEEMAGGKTPWKEITCRAGMYEMTAKGYGVKSEMVGDEERFFLVVPEGKSIAPHHARKS